MKKLLIAMVASLFVLGACGDGNNDLDSAKGETLYAQNCASCHGGDLEGGMGPGLEGASYDRVMEMLVHSPIGPHEDRVSEEEAEEIATWIEDQ